LLPSYLESVAFPRFALSAKSRRKAHIFGNAAILLTAFLVSTLWFITIQTFMSLLIIIVANSVNYLRSAIRIGITGEFYHPIPTASAFAAILTTMLKVVSNVQ
jgi:hypothetical protein